MHRSFETIPYTLAAWGLLLLAIIPTTIISYVFTFPATLLVGKLKKRNSVAAMAFEALGWATVTTLFIYLTGIVAAVTWAPISSHWTVKPTFLNLSLFVFCEIFVTYAVFARDGFYSMVFFTSSTEVLERNSKGKPIKMRLGVRVPISEEWYQDVKKEVTSTTDVKKP